jgi:redox-sensing transcriptional repressor
VEEKMKEKMKEKIPEPTLRRLSYYLRFLERFKEEGKEIISSKELSASLGLSDAQVRRDLFILGEFGKRGVGYDVLKLVDFLNSFLGLKDKQKAILVGCGNLGKALLQYKGFKKRNFTIACAFDKDKRIVGTSIAGIKIKDIKNIKKEVKRQKTNYGINTCPISSAQEVIDKMIDCGIKAILNFAPVKVHAPEDVIISSVDLTTELEWLSFHLHHDNTR